jgi:formylglycine-generating enzyme required for sulfatase activity
VSNDANSGVIRAVFPVTATRINIAAIAGITAPATGGTPVTTVTETAQYTGTVTWNGNPSVFADRTVYTATITLTPKTGYTLQTVATDFFTVAGAITVRNSANSGIVTAVFPATIYSITSQKGIDMVWVPGGSFQMGGTYDDEKPVHTVTLSNFYMSKYEITQAQYQAIMGKNPSYFDGRAGRGPASGEVQENRPVEFVSLYDAMIFCNKLSRAEGLIPAYSVNGSDLQDIYEAPAASDSAWNNAVILSNSNGYRLPTEAQWEYAARGGKGTPWNYTYSGSNTVGDVAWYTSNSGGITHEVGKKAPNCLGLYDMSGNVWEWCWDWYGRSYSSEAQTDPAGPASGYERVIRGGAINSDAGGMHSVARFYRSPNDRWERYLGFRVVRPSE